MGSLIKSYTREKLIGKVYTPEKVVEKILNDTGYVGTGILGKTILDPSCGDGRFLVAAAKRIILYSDASSLKENLEKIHGWDIDSNAVEECKRNLNKLVEEYDLYVNWNIKTCDALKQIPASDPCGDGSSCNLSFDFIVGNPPYIRIQNIDPDQRRFIRENYSFCRYGSVDLYLAFFELCYHLLSEEGICGLITANSYLSTDAGRVLRETFAQKRAIRQITNYGDIQLFKKFATYSAITIFTKKPNEYFLLQEAIGDNKFNEAIVNASELEGKSFWQLSTRINHAPNPKGKPLKEIANIHVGIMTLCDKCYIFSVEAIDEEFVFAFTRLRGKVKLERAILKPIVKVSRLKSSDEPIGEYVLFPFKKVNGKHRVYEEDELRDLFPLTYSYLLSLKDLLVKRDNGKPIRPWYNFGRTQGLDTSFGKKILFAPMATKPNFILYENEECTFYSGYCIKYEGDYDKLLEQLNSDRMKQFIEQSGRRFRNGWFAYNKRIVGEFAVDLE